MYDNYNRLVKVKESGNFDNPYRYEGCALAAMPIPGARIVAAGMIAGGIGSIAFGASEASESLFNVNPLKSLVVGYLGVSEETYHGSGFIIGAISSAGLQVSGLMSNSGTKPKVSQNVNNPPKSTNKVSNVKVLERPVAGDNI